MGEILPFPAAAVLLHGMALGSEIWGSKDTSLGMLTGTSGLPPPFRLKVFSL